MNKRKELLILSHPIFRIQPTRIIWCDNVQKQNTHHSLQQRILVISTLGIFLCKKCSFPKGIKILRVILYGNLTQVKIDSKKVFFRNHKVSMIIFHPNHIQIASIVIAMRNTLFSENILTPEYIIDPSVASQIETFSFKFDSILGERFLSFCLELDPAHFPFEKITNLYESFKSRKTSLLITNDIIPPILMKPAVMAIAYDQHIEKITLRKLNFYSFEKYFMMIVKNNSSLRHIAFKSVKFPNSLTHANLWSENNIFALNCFTFDDCDLTNKGFIEFMNSFKKFSGRVNAFHFKDCIFNIESYCFVFDSFKNMECFTYLSQITFTGIKFEPLSSTHIMTYAFESKFFYLHKNLKDFAFTNNQIDSNYFLEQVLNSHSNLSIMNLSHNSFCKQVKINDFNCIEELDLSSNKFNFHSLSSLFQSLSDSKHSPSSLFLDKLDISESDSICFYLKMADVVIRDLEMISWCNNIMKAPQFHHFCQFLMKQPKLSAISLSGSIQFSDASENLHIFSRVIEKKSIKRLEMKGQNNQRLGLKLIPLLQLLLEKGEIKILDITAQEVGNIGLDIVCSLAEKCLQEVRFDQNLPNSIDILKANLIKMINSKIEVFEWPQKDIHNKLESTSLQNKDKYEKEFKGLKKKFEEKLKRGTSQSCPRESSRSRSNSVYMMRAKSIDNTPRIDYSILKNRMKIVDEAIVECFDSSFQDVDPLISAIEKLDKEVSLNNFLQHIQKST